MLEVRRSGTLLWADLIDPTPGEFRETEATIGVLVDDLAQVVGPGAGPGVVWHDDHAHVTLYSPAHERIDLMLDGDWMVTVRAANHAGHAWTGPGVQRRWTEPDPTPAALLVAAVGDLAGEFLRAVRAGDQRLAGLEEEIFAEHLSERDELQRDLFGARRQVMVLRRSVEPFQDVVEELLRARPHWVDEDVSEGLRVNGEVLQRCIVLLDGQRELLAGAVDAHLALLSHRMNLVMKQLTAWGAVLFAATIVTGLYGMNFTHMPELQWRFGYPAAVGLVLVSMAVTIRHFRGKGWM